MKIWKRLFCLLLSLVLIFSMVSTAFAQTSKQSPNKPNYEFYVPMGTSITGGYRLPGDGTGGTVGKPDGVFSNKYTYAYLVGEEFNIPNHYSGALLGTRALEYRMLLEEDFSEEDVDNYNDIWVGPRCGNTYNHLHNELGPDYKEALANADVISVEIGLNDVTSYAMCTLMTELEDKVEESGEEDLFAYLESLGGEGVAPSSDEMLGILAIADYLGAYEDIFTELTNLFREGLENYRRDFPIVLQDIRKINPNADLFVIGCYNPLGYMLDHEITANENGNIDIKNLILSTGETLSLNAEQTTWLFNLMEEYIVGSQNIIMQDACRRNNATFVDIRGIDLSGSADGTHPYIAGHAFIADHLADAIYGLYPCQHRHLTTYNVVTPTTFIRLGYTGNTYCVDCGALISPGRVITYTEYLRQQQQQGNIPDADAYEEEIDPFEQPPAGEPLSHEGYDVLAFTSDIHNKNGNVSATRLGNWFDSVETRIGAIDFFGANGDYAEGNGSANGDAYWALVNTVVDSVKTAQSNYAKQGYPFNWVLTTGNHEQENGNYNTTTNAVKNDIQMIGEATVPAGANYKVYCFGATQKEYTFRDDEITKLADYLENVPADCPVFVLSHFPLHEQGSRSITGEENVIEVLNQYPNVIFLWGHNHTDAANSENHYDKVFTETIDETPINFTYASAGCMSDSENNSGSAAVKGKGLIVKVDDGDIGDEIYPGITMQYVDESAEATSIVYTVDITGKGVKEVEATEIETGYDYKQVSAPEEGTQYIVAYKDGDKYIALDLTKCGGYTNNSSYRYSGYKGTEVTVTEDGGILKVTGNVTSDMVWKFAEEGNKWTIQNVLTGKYLNGSYVDGMKSGTKDGSIYLSNAKDTWSLSGAQLKSTAAGKTLAFDKIEDITRPFTGAYDFFTVRSTGDDLVFFEVTGDPVPMGEPTPDEEAAVVDFDKQNLVIAYANRALSVSANDGYKNDSDYTYTGLNAKTVSFDSDGAINSSDLTTDILWKFEKVSGNTYRIKNVYTGQYLGSSYTETSSGGRWSRVTSADGKLFLTNDSSYTWTYKGSTLTSVQSKKELAFETPETVSGEYEGSLYFFTVRSNGSTIKMYPHNGTASDPTETQMLGKCYAWRQTNIGNGTFCLTVNGYAIGMDAGRGLVTRQISNESQLADLGARFQWKVKATDTGYSFENVGNSGSYLGAYTESTILTTKASLSVSTAPYSWQFTNNRLATSVRARGFLNLSFSNTYYLSCANGTLSLSTGSISNSVKLYQSVKVAENHAGREVSEIPATCTEAGTRTIRCSECGATITIAIPAAGHVDDNKDSFCDICGYTMDDKPVEPAEPVGPDEPSETEYFVTIDGTKKGPYATGTEVTLSVGTKTGKKFNSWTITGINTEDLDLNANPLPITVGEEDITVTSNWSNQNKVTVDGVTKYYAAGESVTIQAGTKAGYTFSRWNVSKNNGLELSDEDLVKATLTFTMGSKDVTFTPVWEKATHTVKFVTNGGTAYDSLEVENGYVLNLNSYRPTKNGYTFQRWNLDENLTRSAGNSVTVTGDITLYASYTSNGFFGTGENGFSSATRNLFSGISSFFNSFFRW